ncbi:type IV secretion system protein VirB11 [Skermanella aerolata]|uniref:ATPase, T2SS/T4P/T4SS family n=1 Tax=Skermanella aerolata TaxID=393310 RepID=UPI003D21D308
MALSATTRAEAARLLEKSLGPEILACMADPEVEDLFLNADGACFAQYAGRKVRLETVLPPEARFVIIGYAGSIIGTTADGVTRYTVDGKLHSGHRFHGVLPPRAVDGPYIVMRNPPKKIYRIGDYVDAGVMTAAVAGGLEVALADRETIVIVGVTGSGKTSLLTCMLNHPATVGDRIALLEDTEEVNVEAVPDRVVKSTLGGTMRELVYDVLRERPQRIVIGEGRDGAVWDWVKAVMTGHRGSMITLHADNAADGMERLEQLAAEVVTDVATQRSLLIRTVRRLVPVQVLPDGRRHVPGIYEPYDHQGGGYRVRALCGVPIQTII